MGELQAWFATDEDCLDYLDWLRWPEGFVCPRCENAGGWAVADGRYKCAVCGARTSVTAGTLFDRRRTPLTVEVDETYFGGEEPGLRGGRQKGKKVLVGVAVERREPKGFGRCRMAILADGSADSLHPFVTANVEPGATVVTDGSSGCKGIDALGYVHEPHSQRAASKAGEDVGALLPGVHRVASLAKRWYLGTYQGRFDDAHLQSYLDEFSFRFNRRRSRSRGLAFYRVLELAVDHDPVRYRQLVANPRPKPAPPTPPADGGHPPSLDRPRADRPWRAA